LEDFRHGKTGPWGKAQSMEAALSAANMVILLSD
jgi:hypothetical protein